ncbi:MAG: TIGR04282 family arsenosugar biosynthesis glycosyltransferase, partial [Thermodesulfovibrionales bacterium]|nr:TIGR04282 family arsenosugar biosynthesis glycosyltransferase [Thermodesulfovibrionales bacterium]
MSKSASALGIFFRIPKLGKVKRRLAEQIGDELALKAYQAMLSETIKNVQKLAGIDIYGFYDGSLEPSLDFPQNIYYIPQKGKDLGQRMSKAVNYLFEAGYKKVLLIGSDSPDLPLEFINEAFHKLDSYTLVIGPAQDGGYYLIGMNKPFDEIFENISWGNEEVLKNTLLKAKESAIRYFLLPEWYDIDDLESLKRWRGIAFLPKIKW